MIGYLILFTVLFLILYRAIHLQNIKQEKYQVSSLQGECVELQEKCVLRTGHALDLPRLVIIISILALLFVLLGLVLNDAASLQKDLVAVAFFSFFLAGVLYAMSIVLVCPWRFGRIVLDGDKICMPVFLYSKVYRAEDTAVWIHRIGKNTFSCLLSDGVKRSVVFLNRDSADSIQTWVRFSKAEA